MTYINPAFEQVRIDIASALEMKLDPRTRGDVATVGIITAVYGINLLGVVLMLWNRKYPPIKSKSPILMTLVFITSALWFVGDVQINGHVPLAGTAFIHCRSFVQTLRSYRLYCVFRLNMPYIIPFLDVCTVATPFKIAVYVFVWLTWVCLAVINWCIRDIKGSFNESREMTVACFILFAMVLFLTLYSLLQNYRIASTVLAHASTSSIWWGVMGVPLYNCLFHRLEYLDKWTIKLREDGLQREYHVDYNFPALNSNAAAAASDDQGLFYGDDTSKAAGTKDASH
ncbi:hypothetical protein BX661DRAFT_177278 [Kickxella alabastrina]|uniref:uncharacterized protein n=1 Tax=Kickxella alabastrina TaxID=61397 RepID=UPI00221E86FA|nr:uncharacterized protein BX661DRAFT_177278 [Kickxella alabastrina]KAI7833647.1 hypothetical protein BX661DRAFT_177278 [Kickxella alabastrina]